MKNSGLPMRSWNPRTGEFRLKEPRKPRQWYVGLAALLLVVAAALVFSAGRVLTRDLRDDLPRLVKRIQPAVVTVIAYNAQDEPLLQGTGFFITPGGSFLTNCHVLAQAVRAEVRTADGRCYPVKGVVAVDRDWDLVAAAVLSPPEEVLDLSISGAVPEVGERVAVVGSPLGLEQTLSDGVVSAVRRTRGGDYLQISAPVSTGSSGSPVINMKGVVVGVASLQVVKGQNLNFAVPGCRALVLQEKAAAAGMASSPLSTLKVEPALAAGHLKPDHRYAGKRQTKRAAAYHQAIRLQPALARAFSGLGRTLGP
jgi:S1-C subfamily serine protease